MTALPLAVGLPPDHDIENGVVDAPVPTCNPSPFSFRSGKPPGLMSPSALMSVPRSLRWSATKDVLLVPQIFQSVGPAVDTFCGLGWPEPGASNPT